MITPLNTNHALKLILRQSKKSLNLLKALKKTTKDPTIIAGLDLLRKELNDIEQTAKIKWEDN